MIVIEHKPVPQMTKALYLIETKQLRYTFNKHKSTHFTKCTACSQLKRTH